LSEMTAKLQQEGSGHGEDGILDLKALRECRGLTLDDLSQATKISLKNLEALEGGNFHALPPPVYTRSYFRAYAKMLGLEEAPFCDRYEKYLSTAGGIHPGTVDNPPGQKICFPPRSLFQIAGGAALGVLTLLTFAYFNFRSTAPTINTGPSAPAPLTAATPVKKDPLPPQSASKEPPTVVAAEEDPPPPPDQALPKTIPPAPPARQAADSQPDTGGKAPKKPAVLIITAREKTWLRLKEDGAAASQLMMHPGERITRAGARYTLDIGNAGGVSLEFQGKTMKELGKSGQVVHVQLP
jgi:cytoskeleton protein RodZ